MIAPVPRRPGSGDLGRRRVPDVVREVVRSPGASLDPATRAVMGGRFGYDFSQVRIHDDDKAARSAQAVRSTAYTIGNHVVFGSGRYSPGTAAGRRLLAHELAHVVQQRTTLASMPEDVAIGASSDPLEREAERAAQAVLAGGPTRPQSAQATGILQRCGDTPCDCSEEEKLAHVASHGALQLQRQEQPPGLPDLPDVTGCEAVIKGSLKECIKDPLHCFQCCRDIPNAKDDPKRACTSDIVDWLKQFFGPSGGCPPERQSKWGPCCPKGTVFVNQGINGTCCPYDHLTKVMTCCPPEKRLSQDGFRCEDVVIPEPLCPPERRKVDGTCCLPGQKLDPLGLHCVVDPGPPPPPPPKPTPTPNPTPTTTSIEIRFVLDRPVGRPGALAGNVVSGGDGAPAYAKLKAALAADPTLKVQLVGMASSEGSLAYNHELGRRRAQLIADVLVKDGIDRSRIADAPASDLKAQCDGSAGIFTCGVIHPGASPDPADREVLARLFKP